MLPMASVGRLKPFSARAWASPAPRSESDAGPAGEHLGGGHNSAAGILPPSISTDEGFDTGRQRRPVACPAVQHSAGGGDGWADAAGSASCTIKIQDS